MKTMRGIPKLIGGLVGLAFFAMAGTVHASVIYNIDRVVGTGTVMGFIETDGTIGILNDSNIVGGEITVDAPGLGGGSATIVFGVDRFNIFGDALRDLLDPRMRGSR